MGIVGKEKEEKKQGDEKEGDKAALVKEKKVV